MAAVDLTRPAALGLAGLVGLALLPGCTSSPAPGGAAARACRPDSAAPAALARPADALGEPRLIPATPGSISVTATSILDPVPGGKPDQGCRWVGIGLHLHDYESAPASVDLFAASLLVTASGGGYRESSSSPEGRDGIDQVDLVAGDGRRGTLIFQVPAGEPLRYLTVASGALLVDLTAPPTTMPAEPYRPGTWPPLGIAQPVLRLADERLDVTPLRVMDPTPATAGVRAGYRAYAVQLRTQVTGSKPWPLHPENMVTFVDSTGRQWYPGFVTTSAAPPFDPFTNQPGQEQTAWVTAEIPGQAKLVAMMVTSYPGMTWPWRL
jgi:hypothetical protein